jgi:hypothetical protein
VIWIELHRDLGGRRADSKASLGSLRVGINLVPSCSMVLATCTEKPWEPVDSAGERERKVEGNGGNAGGRQGMPEEGRAAGGYLWPPHDLPGRTELGRGSRVGEETGVRYLDAKRCRGLGLDFREGPLSVAIGLSNIQPEYQAPMSSTPKQIKLRYSGCECPNIQCQASIQTSKHCLIVILQNAPTIITYFIFHHAY